jgi:uncharacterized protein YacL
MPGNPLTDPNWAASAADTVERVVATVRTQATDKIVLAARGLVFGLVIAFGGVAALVLLLIVVTRGLQALLALGLDHPTTVWLSYLIVGGILCLGGAFCMAKRHAPAD